MTMTVLAGAADAGGDPAQTALLVLFFGIAPALVPLGIGLTLWRREHEEAQPRRRQQFIDEVHTAIIAGDGVTADEVAESLACPVERVEEALDHLLASGDFAGYREGQSGRLHAMDPLQVRPGECPACGSRLDADGADVTCSDCASRVLKPGESEEAD
jgi:hypothetical protein